MNACHDQPFRHWIGEDYISAAGAAAAALECPLFDLAPWVRYYDSAQHKAALPDWHHFKARTWQIMDTLCRLDVGRLAGRPLLADFGLWGGGLHLLEKGDFVSLHLDADHHPKTKRRRALSGCLYLTECQGGQLQLWDERGQQIVKQITPMPGRLVLFENSDASWHSVAPVTDGVRLSLAVFWHADEAGKVQRPRALFKPG